MARTVDDVLLGFIVGVIIGGFLSWQVAGRMAVRRISEFEHQVRLSRAGLRRSRS
jgi:hypothetical protein